ncbi:MAG: hypothetical protein KA248_09470 [Kiritimatiellae bacterium]|nr:hypothetical protein [Kiritimatiellia bacterium]
MKILARITLNLDRFFSISVLFAGLACVSPVWAQTSSYARMATAGSFNNWQPLANMVLVSNNTWQGDFEITTNRTEFKFVANSAWSTNWGETDQATFAAPLSGTAEKSPPEPNNIILSNGIAGRYHFIFNDATRQYTVKMLYAATSGVNLLNNPGFEVQGSNDSEARHWQWGVPDMDGGKWNNAYRRNWRSRSGTWMGVVQGQWSPTDPTSGGWWRQVPASPGLTYEARGWFYGDNEWTSEVQDIKFEFYGAATNLIATTVSNIVGISNLEWRERSVRGDTPGGTVYIRLVITCDSVGAAGAFQIDDLELRQISLRNQDFNSWGAYTFDACHTLDDWVLCTGRTVDVLSNGFVTQEVARSGYAASLASTNGSSQGGYVQSPRMDSGMGTVHFWYRNGFVGEEDDLTGPVAFRVQTSTDGISWDTVGTVTNVLTLSYVEHSQFIYIEQPSWVRIQHAGGTNRLFIDDIVIDDPADIPRYMDFNSWPDSGTNLGQHTYLDWLVQTGRVWTINAMEGKSAFLPGSTTTINHVRSPLFDNGYGAISFQYARGTNGTGPARLGLQSSTDGISWTTLDVISNILSSSYSEYTRYFYNPVGSYVRICNFTNPPGAAGNVLIDEGFSGGRAAPPLGWTFSGLGSDYTSTDYSGRDIPGLKFDTTGDRIITPALANPTNISFFLRGASTGTSNNQFLVEAAVAGVWSALTNISPLPTAKTTVSLPLSTSVTNVRFTYTKVYGNAAFDDVIALCPPSAPGTLQDLLLDQVNIAAPSLLRYQNFDSWSRSSSYGDYERDGWTVLNAIIETNGAYAGLAPRMRDTGSRSITSPWLYEGLGPVSFYYRCWDTTPVTYLFQTSTNGTTWITQDSILISSPTYSLYSRYFTITNGVYARLFWTNGNRQVYFDEIQLGAPQPPAEVIFNGWHEPETPFTNDAVTLYATAFARYGAQNVSVTSYYRLGTSGVYTVLPMTLQEGITYVATSAIAPRPRGTTVQYYMRCDYTGPGSELTAPKYYPPGGPTSPAAYFVPRNESGRVWINEINYMNGNWFYDDTNEFVELCGPAGHDISGWRVAFYISDPAYTGVTFNYYASYTIPQGTVLSNMTNGFGFYLLGDQPVMNVNQHFAHTNWTYLNDEDDQISDGAWPSGIRLYNEGGGIEQSISYAGPITNFTRVYAEEDWRYRPDPNALQLAGTGSVYDAFNWRTNEMTPGAANAGQSLVSAGPEAPTDLTASDGTYTDRVRLQWSDVATETGFTIWRNTSNHTPTAVGIGVNDAGVVLYDDFSASPGQLYFYWVIATNAIGTSTWSNVDTGYRRLVAPLNLAASDGAYTNKVILTWDNIAGETGYGIWRHPSSDTNAAICIAGVNADVLIYEDFSAVPGQVYYYWVRGSNSSSASMSDFSLPDTGSALLDLVPPDVDIIRLVRNTNVIIYAYGNTGATPWVIQPYFSTNLPTTVLTWQPITQWNGTLSGGTNTVWFDQPQLGSRPYFFRVHFTKP